MIRPTREQLIENTQKQLNNLQNAIDKETVDTNESKNRIAILMRLQEDILSIAKDLKINCKKNVVNEKIVWHTIDLEA